MELRQGFWLVIGVGVDGWMDGMGWGWKILVGACLGTWTWAEGQLRYKATEVEGLGGLQLQYK